VPSGHSSSGLKKYLKPKHSDEMTDEKGGVKNQAANKMSEYFQEDVACLPAFSS
jgi:hypothetical protein